MKSNYELISFHIIEKFMVNVLMTWTYPTITDSLKQTILSNTLKGQKYDFMYYRLDSNWIYIWERYKEHKIYALILITKAHNLEKYKVFGNHLCNIYETNYKPIDIVTVFLGALINKNSNVPPIEHEVYNKHIDVKIHFEALIDLFQMEIILIFNALLLKKRIFVYHANYMYLLKHLEMMTYLIDSKYRNPNEYLFPLVRNINFEIKSRTFFLGGLIDKNININANHFDLFVNLENATIKISPNSKDIFQMTKWHKEIALFLINQEESQHSKKISILHTKTLELLNNLKSFSTTDGDGKGMITLDILRAQKLPITMENFLFNLAVADNIMML